MNIFVTVLALAFPASSGVLLVRLLEGNSPVLYRAERIAVGFLLGGAWSSYILFWFAAFGMPITLLWFLFVHTLLVATLLFMCHLRFPRFSFPPSPKSAWSESLCKLHLPRWAVFLIAWIVVWTLLKIFMGMYDLILTPTYWNDIYASWHMRTKAFYFSQSLLLDLQFNHEYFFGGRVPGYPLTVYLTKLFPMLLRGEWVESIASSVNVFWFLSLLTIFLSALLRATSALWSILGIYLLVSLPIFLIHGSSAYSDILMAAHLFLALYTFFQWLRTSGDAQRSWFKLFALSSAAMIFVKSEALVIFLPPLAVLFVLACFFKNTKNVTSQFFIWLTTVSVVAIPWTLFKIYHGLTFGNAQGISGFSLSPTPGVLSAIEMDLMYTGSYILLFPLFLLVLAITRHFWSHRAIGFLVAFLAIVFVGEICIYWLTPLATEAIRHTGFGRGMVHLMPAVVFVAVALLREVFRVGK